MTDFPTWLHDRFQQAGQTTEHADEHILVARTIGFGPTELTHLAHITGASVEEIDERARAERARRVAAGHNDIEALPEYQLLAAMLTEPDQ